MGAIVQNLRLVGSARPGTALAVSELSKKGVLAKRMNGVRKIVQRVKYSHTSSRA